MDTWIKAKRCMLVKLHFFKGPKTAKTACDQWAGLAILNQHPSTWISFRQDFHSRNSSTIHMQFLCKHLMSIEIKSKQGSLNGGESRALESISVIQLRSANNGREL